MFSCFYTSAAGLSCFLFFFNDTATTEIYTLSLHDALPIYQRDLVADGRLEHLRDVGHHLVHRDQRRSRVAARHRSEEHTSELQSQSNLVCRLLLEKKKKAKIIHVAIAEGVSTGLLRHDSRI